MCLKSEKWQSHSSSFICRNLRAITSLSSSCQNVRQHAIPDDRPLVTPRPVTGVESVAMVALVLESVTDWEVGSGEGEADVNGEVCINTWLVCADVGFVCADVGFVCADVGFVCADVGFVCVEVGFVCGAVGFVCGAVGFVCGAVGFVCVEVNSDSKGQKEHCRVLRGRLKSSHIADKRKNFHMALHPLPPSSNESVIDNGSNVWQMAVHMILVLPHNLPKQCRLSHAGDASLEVQHPLRNEQEDNLEQSNKNMISTFFPFPHGQKQAAGVVLQCRTGVSACHCLQPGKANQYLRWIDCSRMHAPSAFFAWTCLRSRNDLRHWLYWTFALICKRHSAIGWWSRFFFFLLSIAQRIGSKPPPSHMKVLSFVRDVWTFEMTPYFVYSM